MPQGTTISGSITVSTTWTAANGPYTLATDVTILPTVTLTIEPGTVIAGNTATELRVEGHLQSLGTATQPITFTGTGDGGYYGWSGLVFASGIGHLAYTTVMKTGQISSLGTYTAVAVQDVTQGQVWIEQSTIRDALGCATFYCWEGNTGLLVTNSHVTLDRSTLTNIGNYASINHGPDYAIWVTGASSAVTLTNNLISNTTGWALRTTLDHFQNSTLHDNTFTDNGGQNRILLEGGTLTHDFTLPHQLGGADYQLLSSLVVTTGVRLTLPPATTVWSEPRVELRILGDLQSLGTPTQPITFTGTGDGGYYGWSGLVFASGTGHLAYTTVQKTGQISSLGTYTAVAVQDVTQGQVWIEQSTIRDALGCATFYCWEGNTGLLVNNSHVTLDRSTLTNIGNYASINHGPDYAIWVTGASSAVTLTNNLISNTTGWALRTTLDHFQNSTLHDNTFTDNGGQNRILLEGGTLTHDFTLPRQLGGADYQLLSSLVVTTGVRLTLPPATTVWSEPRVELRILGDLQSLGTPTQPITFTGTGDGGYSGWSGLVFVGGTGHLAYTTVQKTGQISSLGAYTAVAVQDVTQGQVWIEQSTIRDALGCATFYCWEGNTGLLVNNSHVTLDRSTLTNIGNYASINHGLDYAIYATGTSTVLTVTNIIAQNNGAVGLAVTNGASVPLVADSTFASHSSWGFLLDAGTITAIRNTAILTSTHGGLLVTNGATIASITDSRMQGSTGPGVRVAGGGAITTLDRLRIQGHAGAGLDVGAGGTITTVRAVVVEANGSGVLLSSTGRIDNISGSRIQSNAGWAIDAAGPIQTLTTTQFLSNTAGALQFRTMSLATFTGNTFSGNGRGNRIVVQATAQVQSLTLTSNGGLGGVELLSSLTVPHGITLTLGAGMSVLVASSAELKVLGHLEAVGTATQPITFTSLQDTGPYQWRGLAFDGSLGTGGTGRLVHATVRYGGQPNSVFGFTRATNIAVRNVQAGRVSLEHTQVLSSTGGGNYSSAAIYAENSQLNLANTTVQSNGSSSANGAVVVEGASRLTVTNSDIVGNTGSGIIVAGPSQASIIQTRILSNTVDGIRVTGTNPRVTIVASSVVGNGGKGINNTTTTEVDARWTWWGDPSGPQHATNPTGTGSAVTDYVRFEPWLTAVAQPNTAIPRSPFDHTTLTYESSDQYPHAPLPGWHHRPLQCRRDARRDPRPHRQSHPLPLQPRRLNGRG